MSEKNKNDEIDALRAELAEVKAEAEAAKRAKNAFFTSVVHEIRTSMNAVAGMAELLENSENNEKTEIIKTHSEIMIELVEDLLDFSRIENGTFDLQPEHYYFPALLEKITNTARLKAREKALKFTTEFREEIPPYLYGDSAKLARVLANLLSNAVKFTDKGSVTLSLNVKENTLEFAVSDTGAGIKPEDCSKLFDYFKQIEERRNKGLTGLGLGLTITDNIIRAMNGKLTVESIYGFGSTFRVEIPFEAGDEEQASISEDANNHVYAPEAKVLIVDDIDVNLSVGAGFLKLHGITADIATNAKDAIKRVCEKDYDIVFMDHMMPETDGGKASEIIRSFGGKYAKNAQNNSENSLKIIALTASVSPETKALMLESGMDDFLPKPVTKQSLNQMLKKWLPADKYETKSEEISEQSPEDKQFFSELAEKAEGLNTELGFKRSGGTAQAYRNSLKLLYRRIPKSLEKLEKYLSCNSMHDFKVEAHGMKGALAINGLERLSGSAYGLELAAEAENADVCRKNLPGFAEKLSALKAILAETFPEKAEAKETKKEGGRDALARIIESLIINVERFDRTLALEEIESAMTLDFGEGDKLFSLLKADLEDFDYDSAMEKLQSFNTGGKT